MATPADMAGAVKLPAPPSGTPTPPEQAPTDTAALDRSFIRSVAWTGGVKWVTQLLTWASTFIVARLLTPEDYGLVGMATVYLGVVTLISEFGLGVTVVTLRELTRDQIAQLNSVSLMIGAASFVISCAAAIPLGWFFNAPQLPAVVMVMSLAFLITAFRIVPGALLQRELQFKTLALLEGAQALVLASTMVLFAWLGYRYWTLVIGAVLGAAVITALTLVFRRHGFAWPRLETMRYPLRFTKHQLVGNLAWYTYSNADFLVAGRLLGQAQLGVYTFAWSLALTLPEKITGMITRVTPAYFSAVQKDPPALRRYLLKLTEVISLLTFPALLGLALVAEDLVLLALGEQWHGVVAPLRVLAVYAAYDSATGLFSRVLTVTGETAFLMRMGVVLAILMPIAFVIGSRWGPVGIASAWIVAYPFTRVPIFMRLQRRIDLPLSVYLRAYWPAGSGAACMVAAVLVVQNTLPEAVPGVVRLAAQVATGAFSYVLAISILHQARARALLQALRGSAAA